MKATIIEITSGNEFVDGEVRVMLRIEGADHIYDKIRVPWRTLDGGATGPQLNQDYELDICKVPSLGEYHGH
jgi:hypothetical protein